MFSSFIVTYFEQKIFSELYKKIFQIQIVYLTIGIQTYAFLLSA